MILLGPHRFVAGHRLGLGHPGLAQSHVLYILYLVVLLLTSSLKR